MAQHRHSWIERTLEEVVLPAITPVATVRAAGSAQCRCMHRLLAHGSGVTNCRSCACPGYEPAVPAA